jgi:hypothetical protein
MSGRVPPQRKKSFSLTKKTKSRRLKVFQTNLVNFQDNLVEVVGDMRASALQRRITRKYPQISSMMDFVRQQNNNNYCVLYALNNIIQCSPYIYDKRPYTVPEMVNACNNLVYDPKDSVPRKYCNEQGNFTFRAVNWLLEHNPIQDKIICNYYDFNIIGKQDFSQEVALTDLDKNLITVGFMFSVNRFYNKEQKHVIAVINLQPLTLKNVNYVVIDSERQCIVVTSNDNPYLSNFDNLYLYLKSIYSLENLYVNILRKIVSDKTVQELKSLHDESQTDAHSYYLFE